jgi:hypothetical protein
MRRSPSIVPDAVDSDVYLVLDDFGRLGRPWRETDEESTGRTAIIQDLMEGQYNMPVRVIAFNIAKGWSRDVSEEIADELAQAFAQADEDIPGSLKASWRATAAGRCSCRCRSGAWLR